MIRVTGGAEPGRLIGAANPHYFHYDDSITEAAN
jgi:hypothetical protein